MNRTEDPPGAFPISAGMTAWIWPVAATLLLQMAASFLLQFLPIMAPILMEELGWSNDVVGYLVATTMFGSIAFLILGTPLIRLTGPVRAVQISLVVGAFGLVTIAAPFWFAPLLASLMIGLAYGPATPATSDILHRYAPPCRRSLIFSIKQAGVPVGGATAGLLLPLITAVGGWKSGLLLGAVICIGSAAIVQLVRRRIDAESQAGERRPHDPGLLLARVREPFSALSSGPQLLRLAFAGHCLAISQGAWNAFFVTYLVAGLGLDLRDAGYVFAAMQLCGVVGRVSLGWLADRVGSGPAVIRGNAIATFAATLMIAAVPPDWPLWSLVLLAGLAGIGVSGWNGIQLAEVAHRAPRERIGEASSGATVFVYMGFIVGPFAFGATVAATGRFDVAFLGVALPSVFAFAILSTLGR